MLLLLLLLYVIQTYEQTNKQTNQPTDPDKHHVCLHIIVRLCYIILFIFSKNINHITPSRQECEKAYDEQRDIQASIQAHVVGGQRGWQEQPGVGRRPARRRLRWAPVEHVKRA